MRRLCIIASTTVAFSMATPAANAVPIPPGQGVSFHQLNFPTATPPESFSRYGQVEIEMAPLLAVLPSGFVNVATSAGWIVQNVPVLPNLAGYEVAKTTFDLGSSGPVTSLMARVDYDSIPALSFSFSGSDLFDVDSVSVATGGFGDAALMAAGPMPPPPPPGTIAFNILAPRFTACIQLPLHTNLEAAVNQCAPMATACNFDWLRARHGITIGHPHRVGLGRVTGLPAPNRDCQTLVGELDVTMGRTLAPNTRRFGLPIGDLGLIMGKLSYMSQGAANLRGLTVQHQAWMLNQCFSFIYIPPVGVTICGLNSTVAAGEANGAPTFTFIHNEICHDEAVELCYAVFAPHPMPPPAPNPCNFVARSGHVVQVVASGTVRGIPYIFHRSDTNQLDDTAGTRGVQFCFLLEIPLLSIFTGQVDAPNVLNMLGEPGTPDVVTVVTQSPPAPIGLDVEDLGAAWMESGVRLSWRLGLEARQVIEGVEVQRSAAAGGPWTTRTAAPLVPAENMAFEDTQVDPGADVWYRVVVLLPDEGVRASASIRISTATAVPEKSRLEVRWTRGRGEDVEIRYTLPRSNAPIDLSVYAVNGQLVRRLDSGIRPSGQYVREWNRTDDRGGRVARGVYMIRLTAGGRELAKKVVIAHD